MTPRSHRHLGDLLSALLDGELASADEAEARAHLSGCVRCADELAGTARARIMVRSLPALDPPFGFIEALVLRPRRWRAVLAGAASAAAAVVTLALTGAAAPEPVAPAIPQLVDAHAATQSVSGDPISQLVPAGVPVTFRPSP